MHAPMSVAGVNPFNDFNLPDTTQRMALGIEVEAIDPWWGYGLFRYVKSNDAILKGSLVNVGTAPTFLATLTPSTANLGQPVAVAMAPMASGTYGWVQLVGNAIYAMGATGAADAALGIHTSAGSLSGTVATGKGIIGLHHYKAPAATMTFTANTYIGKNYVDVPGGYDGAFLGMVLTGTGMGAATNLVAKLDPDGRRIYTGATIGTADKLQTATGTITLTGTYTGYGMGYLSRPHGTQVTA